jgi:ligand-binding sensor domain-containing protein
VGHVWIGANTGLFVYDEATQKLATYDLGVADPAVSQITVDPSTSPPTVWVAVPDALVEVVGVPEGLSWQDTVTP